MSTNTVDAKHLLAFLERLEKVQEEIDACNDDKRDIYAEAKGVGYDPKIIKKIVTMRRQDTEKRREEEEILEVYLSALGMA